MSMLACLATKTSSVTQKDGTLLSSVLRLLSPNNIAGNASELGKSNQSSNKKIQGPFEQKVETAKNVLLRETDQETKSLQTNLKEMKTLSDIEKRFEKYLKKLNESFDKLKKIYRAPSTGRSRYEEDENLPSAYKIENRPTAYSNGNYSRLRRREPSPTRDRSRKRHHFDSDKDDERKKRRKKENPDIVKDSQGKSTDPTAESFEAQSTESETDVALEQMPEIAGADAAVQKDVLSQGNVITPQSQPANPPSKCIEKKVSEEDISGEQCSPETMLPEITFKEATKVATIGPKGGKMDLHDIRVIFRKNAVKKNIQFKLSINNKRKNFPKKGMAITPIVDLQPSMEFDVPVLVKMRTWFCAAKGKELRAQVYVKEDGGDWELDQYNKSIPLTDKNEISFYVHHFSGKIGTVSNSDKNEGLLCFLNDVYIQRGTGSITSVFCQDRKALSDCEAGLYKTDYKKIMPLHEEIKGKLGSELQVAVSCVIPPEVKYRQSPLSIQLKEMSESTPHISRIFSAPAFPSEYSGRFEADYAVKFQEPMNEDKEHIATVLSLLFPIAPIPVIPSDRVNVNVVNNNKQNNPFQAMKAAGSMSITEEGATNTFSNKQ